MSEFPRARRDRGMTLPEVLITMTLIGLVAAVITTAITVTLRQASSTEGRLNVARSEQNIGFYVPLDLASAASVDTDPKASPCGTTCPPGFNLTGSNAMMLTWTEKQPGGGSLLTNISYHFFETDVPGVFQIDRIVCTSLDAGPFSCTRNKVLGDLPGPPGSDSFIPGETEPTWVLQVSDPLKPDATDSSQTIDRNTADRSTLKDANRVVVTVNGGGKSSGAGGGTNQISITAGGTSRDVLDPDSVVNAPSFRQARSRCGGPITLVIDDSGSIGAANITTVENGVVEFVKALAGTPTKIQVVRFDSTATVVGAQDSNPAAPYFWTRYYDMLDSTQVGDLVRDVPLAISVGGGTNWEDGWFRAVYMPDGTYQDLLPKTVVFFTDGDPTTERLRGRSAPGQLIADNPPMPGPTWPRFNSSGQPDDFGTYYSTGSDFSQVAFNRTDWIVDDVRGSVRVIGVGVGPNFNSGQTRTWIEDPGTGYHYDTYRGYRQYQSASVVYQKLEYDYQRGYHRSGGRRIYSAPFDRWEDSTESAYYASPRVPAAEAGWRRTSTGRWLTISQAEYDARNTTPDSTDGFRRTFGTWGWISAAAYAAGNITPDETDGFRDSGKQYVTRNSDAIDWELWPSTVTGGGYRQVENPTPPFTHYRNPRVSNPSPSTVTILSRLVAGADVPIFGTYNTTTSAWDNIDSAELFVLPDFTKFVSALKAIALGDCGGTVTMSTRTNGGATDAEVIFENSAILDSTNMALPHDGVVLGLTRATPAATFDFGVGSGDYITVDLRPRNFSDLEQQGYSYAGWTCTVGNQAVVPAPEVFPLDDPAWSGIKVRVKANEAISCRMDMTK